jgi:hypothetical protein
LLKLALASTPAARPPQLQQRLPQNCNQTDGFLIALNLSQIVAPIRSNRTVIQRTDSLLCSQGLLLVERRNRSRRNSKTKQQLKNERTVMKATTLVISIMAAMLLSGSATVLLAQNAATPTCPLGQEPGYGRTLTPEQRAEHRAAMQQLVSELRAKRDAGTITAEEAAWLAQVEQRGGKCIGGPNQGRGQGPRDGTGNQYRQGRKAGSPQAAVAPAEHRAPVLYAQGKGAGKGKGTGPRGGTGNKNGKGKKGGKGTGPHDGSGNKNSVVHDDGVAVAA